MLIVEFAGLPGAGKTTAGRQITQHFRSLGWRCGDRRLIGGGAIRRAEHYCRFGTHILTRSALVRSVILCALSVRPFRTSRLPRALALAAWPYRFHVAQRGGYDLVVLDQGVVQNTWSMLVGGELEAEERLHAALRHVLGQTSAIFAFVHFDIGVDIAVKRCAGRATMASRVDRLDAPAARRLLHNHGAQLQTILSTAVALTNAPHARVDTHRPLDEVCADVTRFIEALLEGAAGQAGGPALHVADECY